MLSLICLVITLLRISGASDCGLKEGSFSKRFIYGGTPAPRSQWPWVVSISRNGIHLCGGALVDNTTILTAAHCIEHWDDLASYKVSVRAPGRNESEILNVASGVFHELFDPTAVFASRMHHDIAVLKLSKVPKTVTTICLPKKETTVPTINAKCIVAGWGEIEDGERESGDGLRYVSVPIIEKSLCEAAWGTSLDDSIICAGKSSLSIAERRGSCAGDSGGPLMCQIGHKWFLFGIVNFGSETCLIQPGAYANVQHLLTWIENATKNRTESKTEWIKGHPGASCDNICSAKDLSPVVTGSYKGKPYRVCAGLSNGSYGYLPGWQAGSGYNNNKCYYPVAELVSKATSTFHCLCSQSGGEWLTGIPGVSCDSVCSARSLSPVVTGRESNGQLFHVCAGLSNGSWGYLPGWQSPTGRRENKCHYPIAGRVVQDTSTIRCLCH